MVRGTVFQLGFKQGDGKGIHGDKSWWKEHRFNEIKKKNQQKLIFQYNTFIKKKKQKKWIHTNKNHLYFVVSLEQEEATESDLSSFYL